MKGCILQNGKVSIKDICNYIECVNKYNWLITNIECYPSNKEIIKTLNREYCWITGDNLLQLLNKEDFQWIWGVFSAFNCKFDLKEVLNYNLPYADGYTRFWKNPISIQHPLADMEIAAWDGILILFISKENEVIEKVMKDKTEAKDLEIYNIEKD